MNYLRRTTSAAANNGLSTTTIPPCSAASFEVNSELHTGARPSVRLCVGAELARCVHIQMLQVALHFSLRLKKPQASPAPLSTTIIPDRILAQPRRQESGQEERSRHHSPGHKRDEKVIGLRVAFSQSGVVFHSPHEREDFYRIPGTRKEWEFKELRKH